MKSKSFFANIYKEEKWKNEGKIETMRGLKL